MLAAMVAVLVWLVNDAFLLATRKPLWYRLILAAILVLGTAGLLGVAFRALRGNIRGWAILMALRDTITSTGLAAFYLWVFAQCFWFIQKPEWRRVARPLVSGFSDRVGFWIFWVIVVPFALVVLAWLLNLLYRAFRGTWKVLFGAREEPAKKPS